MWWQIGEPCVMLFIDGVQLLRVLLQLALGDAEFVYIEFANFEGLLPVDVCSTQKKLTQGGFRRLRSCSYEWSMRTYVLRMTALQSGLELQDCVVVENFEGKWFLVLFECDCGLSWGWDHPCILLYRLHIVTNDEDYCSGTDCGKLSSLSTGSESKFLQM